MANYYATSRTNYFRVTDEEQYKELFSRLVGFDDDIADFTEQQEGVIWHGFGCYGTIDYRLPEDKRDAFTEFDLDTFFRELQKILPDDEAFILLEAGHEKLRYVTGNAFIITRDKISYCDMTDMAVNMAKEMLEDHDFTTKCDY